MPKLKQPDHVRRADLNIRELPEETIRAFRSYCVRRGYTMKSAIEHLILKTTVDNKPLPIGRDKPPPRT